MKTIPIKCNVCGHGYNSSVNFRGYQCAENPWNHKLQEHQRCQGIMKLNKLSFLPEIATLSLGIIIGSGFIYWAGWIYGN